MTRLTSLLMRHEGLRLVPYTDTAGKVTIGCGRNLTDHGMSRDEAALMLANDIAWVMRELLECDFYVTLDDVRRDAIGDMYFNLGAARFLGFKNLILALNAKSWDLAADAVLNSLWASEVKSRASDIASMLRSGEYPS